MGLMDKFKNLFTDEEVVEEEEDEVEIKEVKKEEKHKLPTFMREKIAKEEQEEKIPQVMKIEQEEIEKEIKLERKIDEEPQEEEKTFKFPIDIEENDFTETRASRQSLHARERNIEKINEQPTFTEEEIRNEKIAPPIKQPKKELKVSELYKDKKEVKKKDDKRFRATPIISPIYGVLDKNYDPQDVENNKGHNLEDARPSKSVDFDSVRKKAYGNISEELKENLICENCEYLKEAKECKKRHSGQDTPTRYETLEDEYSNELEYENITMDEAAENYYDYGVEYEKKPVEHEEKKNYYIDEETDDNQLLNLEEEKTKRKKEIPPVKSSINLLSTLKKSMGDEPEEEKKEEKNLELTDDLFNLIDSMYDERNDK